MEPHGRHQLRRRLHQQDVHVGVQRLLRPVRREWRLRHAVDVDHRHGGAAERRTDADDRCPEIKYSDAKSVSNGIENLRNCPTLAAPTSRAASAASAARAFGWDDMRVYKFGAAWDYTDTWTWRAGFSMTNQADPEGPDDLQHPRPGRDGGALHRGFTQKLESGNEVTSRSCTRPRSRCGARRISTDAAGHAADAAGRTRTQLQLEAVVQAPHDAARGDAGRVLASALRREAK